MFSNRKNMSKLAFIRLSRYLEKKNFDFIDCQVPTPHLTSLGAKNISRKEYLERLNKSLAPESIIGKWKA